MRSFTPYDLQCGAFPSHFSPRQRLRRSWQIFWRLSRPHRNRGNSRYPTLYPHWLPPRGSYSVRPLSHNPVFESLWLSSQVPPEVRSFEPKSGRVQGLKAGRVSDTMYPEPGISSRPTVMTGIAWRGNNDHHAGPQKATRRYRLRSSPQPPNQNASTGVWRVRFWPVSAGRFIFLLFG
jgi:hypothetical protein